MNKSDFYFDLPEELIAQTPIKERDTSKLMVVDRQTGNIDHKQFKDIIKYLKAGDCLVLNNTKVLPARLFGAKEHTGGKVEFLLLKRIEGNKWETLVKPGKKAKPGDVIVFGDGILKANILEVGQEGSRIVEFVYKGIFEEILDQLGSMPLPPYIKEKLDEKERYQTVYAKEQGSAAAPTAGLHFTKELIEDVKNKGVKIAYVTLHVGLGTFRPVKADSIYDHKMHEELYIIDKEAADIINKTKEEGGRVISVGTTSTRTLESAADELGKVKAESRWTDIFMYPGYEFKVVDGIITNFHLPESTLIMLVSAFMGRERTLNAYEEAIKNKYRFFSFGDAMFII
ncbi:tRNA preQ1(34) S-adenosylmethionine ribosyltransferase-isomerase QueA [Anaeromicrobium sediminis]|uniref:S-adenosylmethionine:tRNA ribosyltransferase-isomerase n=1 Tax=Anaeromicrobium sediminis TaxID=1478221 RepID=A0A267MPR2_9FIRM|nr:tRNA preQ1(34) S-adenosylmethionine ribosyltransferase-isomerase QueA [Anaeromicrobium sediminis]PAB60888.1 tRNA preQ1(34) S-adenosylmethionine ribosyltransferase-isomerase QueA [Anaeromicrobium sediminis]